MLILLDSIITNNYKYDGYNKIVNERLSINLTPRTSGLIITTVTGDQNYILNGTKQMFKELGILHLIALSGSNIVIFMWFIRSLRRKASGGYFILMTVVLLLYFIFTNELHPLARAIIFMTLSELYLQVGLEKHIIKYYILLAVLSYYLLLWSGFSMSMLLSLIFSLSIYLYESIRQTVFPDLGKLFNHFWFSIYMFLVSIPVYIFIFNSTPSLVLLISNLIIGPLFEFTLYVYYLLYFLFLIKDFELPAFITQFLELPIYYIDAIHSIFFDNTF